MSKDPLAAGLGFCAEALGCDQVAEALNSNALAPPHIPQPLLHALLQAPALLAALRSMIAGAGAGQSAGETPAPLLADPLPLPLLVDLELLVVSKYMGFAQLWVAHFVGLHRLLHLLSMHSAQRTTTLRVVIRLPDCAAILLWQGFEGF